MRSNAEGPPPQPGVPPSGQRARRERWAQLKRKLTKLASDPAIQGIAWPELLPRALRAIHDTPGESGYSPYELVFGRHRPMAGLPYRPRREAEDAKEFFSRMEKTRLRAAELLNEKHAKRAKATNSGPREPEPLKVGSKVWYSTDARR